MKRYFCDRCGKEIDIEKEGFSQMRVTWWTKGGVDKLEYKPDVLHRDGNEDFMFCASCSNQTFGELAGMEE